MKQEGYVNAEGAQIVHKEIDKKVLLIRLGVVGLIIVIIVFIFFFVQKTNKNKKCIKIEDTFASAAMTAAKSKKNLPTAEGKSVTIDMNELIQNGGISTEESTVDKESCKGNVTITRYKDDYFTSVNVTGCGYCATEKRYGKWRESDKMPKGNAYVELIPTYNYYKTETNYGKWGNYLEPDALKKKVDKKYKVVLPLEDRNIPTIPDDGHIVTIEKEDKNYYRYQDKSWRYYTNLNANCSAYSSEQPSGYGKKDTGSEIVTSATPWSLSYPDVKSYRSITSRTGYRWYYKDGKKKIYWKNGAYTVEQPDEKYTEKDNSSAMYSYTDRMWRWCNGETRRYSSYSSVPRTSYPHRDDETIKISNWTGYFDTSRLDDSSRPYRTEEIQVRSRYRYKYEIYSLHQLDQYVTLDKFEKTIGVPLEKFIVTPNIKVEVKYNYRYKK